MRKTDEEAADLLKAFWDVCYNTPLFHFADINIHASVISHQHFLEIQNMWINAIFLNKKQQWEENPEDGRAKHFSN